MHSLSFKLVYPSLSHLGARKNLEMFYLSWKHSIRKLSPLADNARGLSPIHSSSRSQSPAPIRDGSLIPPVSSLLTNPLLAFIKAYRLRGDVSGLRNALLSVVDSSLLVDAHKSLW